MLEVFKDNLVGEHKWVVEVGDSVVTKVSLKNKLVVTPEQPPISLFITVLLP